MANPWSHWNQQAAQTNPAAMMNYQQMFTNQSFNPANLTQAQLQQYQQWQAQYQQWQTQYGQKYLESVSAMQQVACNPPLPASAQPPPPPPSNAETVQSLTEAQKSFEKEYKNWEEQYEKWKKDNEGHPNQAQYKEYEAQWENMRKELNVRREDYKRKIELARTEAVPAQPPRPRNVESAPKPLLPTPTPDTNENFPAALTSSSVTAHKNDIQFGRSDGRGRGRGRGASNRGRGRFDSNVNSELMEQHYEEGNEGNNQNESRGNFTFGGPNVQGPMRPDGPKFNQPRGPNRNFGDHQGNRNWEQNFAEDDSNWPRNQGDFSDGPNARRVGGNQPVEGQGNWGPNNFNEGPRNDSNRGPGPGNRGPNIPNSGPGNRGPNIPNSGPGNRGPNIPNSGPGNRGPNIPNSGPGNRGPNIPNSGPGNRGPNIPNSGPGNRGANIPNSGPGNRGPNIPNSGPGNRGPNIPNSGPGNRGPNIQNSGPGNRGANIPNSGPGNRGPNIPNSGPGNRGPNIPNNGPENRRPNTFDEGPQKRAHDEPGNHGHGPDAWGNHGSKEHPGPGHHPPHVPNDGPGNRGPNQFTGGPGNRGPNQFSGGPGNRGPNQFSDGPGNRGPKQFSEGPGQNQFSGGPGNRGPNQFSDGPGNRGPNQFSGGPGNRGPNQFSDGPANRGPNQFSDGPGNRGPNQFSDGPGPGHRGFNIPGNRGPNIPNDDPGNRGTNVFRRGQNFNDGPENLEFQRNEGPGNWGPNHSNNGPPNPNNFNDGPGNRGPHSFHEGPGNQPPNSFHQRPGQFGGRGNPRPDNWQFNDGNANNFDNRNWDDSQGGNENFRPGFKRGRNDDMPISEDPNSLRDGPPQNQPIAISPTLLNKIPSLLDMPLMSKPQDSIPKIDQSEPKQLSGYVGNILAKLGVAPASPNVPLDEPNNPDENSNIEPSKDSEPEPEPEPELDWQPQVFDYSNVKPATAPATELQFEVKDYGHTATKKTTFDYGHGGDRGSKTFDYGHGGDRGLRSFDYGHGSRQNNDFSRDSSSTSNEGYRPRFRNNRSPVRLKRSRSRSPHRPARKDFKDNKKAFPESRPRTGVSPDLKSKPALQAVLVEDLIHAPGRHSRPHKIVFILRGISGSGKSFVTRLIKEKESEFGGAAPRILSLDDYFMIESDEELKDAEMGIKKKVMKYEYDEAMESVYQAALLKAFKKTISDGYFQFIIVDAMNKYAKEVEQMWSFAKQKGFQVYICEMDNDVATCCKRNIHHRTEKEVETQAKDWEQVSNQYLQLDVRSLLQSEAIDDVVMEDVDEGEAETEKGDQQADDEDEPSMSHFLKSKWDDFESSGLKLDLLDGLPKKRDRGTTIEEYLSTEDEWPARETSASGKKRVRWADMEEKRQQSKIRAVGFVVGQTDWDRMMDPTFGESALTRTKYI